MYRKHIKYIAEWFSRASRKPLIIRGARQVGKTTAVTLAAEALGVNLITLNMEDPHSFVSELPKNDPETIFELIALAQGQHTLDLDKTVFFFDEAQEHPAIIPFLRYCYEKAPQYRVILTGSLLEFVINAPDFSFPVGRVEFLYINPMTFEEYLRGVNQIPLAEKLPEFSWENLPSAALHAIYNEHLRAYVVTGGMPEAVRIYRDTQSWLEVARVKESILETYQADFGKYHRYTNSDVIRQVFRKLPFSIAQKTIYANLASGERSETNKKALEALELAKVVVRCFHSAGNAAPLGAEQKDNHFKTFFLDVGLVLTALGLQLDSVDSELNNTAKGVVAEQFIAQHLLDDRELFQKPQLHYWQRQKKGATSEVDFLSVHKGQVVPIEVKSGASGRMKSLQVFMDSKASHADIALRFLNNLPEKQVMSGAATAYELISLPHYLVEYWRRWVL
ncbi:MAG: ATP-binding protein [Leucothrix sp.]